MAETCYCGCDREVTGDDLALSETGQNIREILDVLKNLSLPLSQEIPEAKDRITRLISDGERFDELIAGLIHGTVETPCFMPVGTLADVKLLEPRDLHELGATMVLANTYHLWLRPGRETLVAAGYQPEIAYFECLHELKLIVDLMYEGGLEKMRWSISDTAEYGDYSRGPRVVNADTKVEMKRILTEIQDGTFAREWIAEDDEGRPAFDAYRAEAAAHPIVKVGATLRGLMSWIRAD